MEKVLSVKTFHWEGTFSDHYCSIWDVWISATSKEEAIQNLFECYNILVTASVPDHGYHQCKNIQRPVLSNEKGHFKVVTLGVFTNLPIFRDFSAKIQKSEPNVVEGDLGSGLTTSYCDAPPF